MTKKLLIWVYLYLLIFFVICQIVSYFFGGGGKETFQHIRVLSKKRY